MDKLNYAQIDFSNCGLDYDYTICEWSRVGCEIDAAEIAFADAEENDFEEYGKSEIKITPVSMTKEDFEKWQFENID